MPLRESKIKPQSWEDIKEQFAIFYASKDNDGVMWCPVRSPHGRSEYLPDEILPAIVLGLSRSERDR